MDNLNSKIYLKLLEYIKTNVNYNFTLLNKVIEYPESEELHCAVIITNIFEQVTGNHHSTVGIVHVEDITGRGEAIFFPPVYKANRQLLKVGKIICLACKFFRNDTTGEYEKNNIIPLIGIAVK